MRIRSKALVAWVVVGVMSPAALLCAQTKFTVTPENQPADTASPETMKLYSAINQKLADASDKSVSACLQTYAVYQACKGGDAATACGVAPTCKVTAVLPAMAMGGIELEFTPGQEAAAVVPTMVRGVSTMPVGIKMIKEDAAPPPAPSDGTVGTGHETPGGVGVVRMDVAPGPGTLPRGPVRIAGGVIAGARTLFVQPVYPAAAKAAHMSGTVVMRAVITKDGSIGRLTVASSTNGMFDDAAIDAVRQWRYRPYLLNGEPTEVDTTITVNFAMSPPRPPDVSRPPFGSPSDPQLPGIPH
jgi:TonB family protein